MTVTVDWPNKVISVPRADMALIQSVPSEIRELSLVNFHGVMRDLEASSDGVLYPDMHNYAKAASVGGVTLAPVVTLKNDYTLTFEDGQYAVNLVAANSNLGDRVNVNQVSVRSANSAGLVQTREIEQASYNNRVAIDVTNGTAGTAYPLGTLQAPVNNLTDALFIASLRGFDSFYVLGNLTIASGENVSSKHFYGQGATLNVTKTLITLADGCITTNAMWHSLRITGKQGGESNYVDCIIDGIWNAHCHYKNCGFILPTANPAYTIQHSSSISNTHITDLHDCYSDEGTALIDRNGTGLNQIYIRYSGRIQFKNQNKASGSGTVWINMNGGTVTIDATCTTGGFIISGNCTVVNNSGGATVDVTQVSASSAGSGPTVAEIAAEVIAQLMATAVPVNMVQVKGQALAGAGSEADPWGPSA